MQQKLYVQYGCGWSAPQGWRNFDASPALRFERLPVVGRLYTKNAARFPQAVEFGDIVKGLPIEANACDGIYCSHVLEHLALSDFRRALGNTYGLLKQGATFRLVLPDLLSSARRYLDSSSPDASFVFLRETNLGEEDRARSFKGFLLHWLGNSRHLWMWDYKSMSEELKAAGFVNIRRAKFGDSPDAMFATVEQKDRWDDCLGVECTRP